MQQAHQPQVGWSGDVEAECLPLEMHGASPEPYRAAGGAGEERPSNAHVGHVHDRQGRGDERESEDLALLRSSVAKLAQDRARLERQLVHAETQQLVEDAAAATRHDAEAHGVVEELCEQLLHERLERLCCLEIVRDLSQALSTEAAGEGEARTGDERATSGCLRAWDKALERARRVLQDACDEWDAARVGEGGGEGSEDDGEGPRGPGAWRWRDPGQTFSESVKGEVVLEARHAEMVQALARARARCRQAVLRGDKLERTVLTTRAECAKYRHETRAARDLLVDVERRQRQCEAEVDELQEQVRAGKEAQEALSVLELTANARDKESRQLEQQVQDGETANAQLHRELADARNEVQQLLLQKSELQQRLQHRTPGAAVREAAAAEAGAADDQRVFGLQASIVALNASLLSYQQDVQDLQHELEAERALSGDLEHVIRSTLERHSDAAEAAGEVAAQVWSQEAQLLFEDVLRDLQARGKRKRKNQQKGEASKARNPFPQDAQRRLACNDGSNAAVAGTDYHKMPSHISEYVESLSPRGVLTGHGVGMQHFVAASARQDLSNERSRAREAKVETRSLGMDDSSADSSSVSPGGGRDRTLREQHAKWQVAVASAEWGLVRARVAWEELSKVHKRARELLGAVLELHGREREDEGTSDAHGRRIDSERTGERRWGEIERFLVLALPSMPEALQQGWLVGVEGSGEANVSFHGAPLGSSSDGAVGDAGRRGLKVTGWGAAGGDMDVGLDMKMLRLHVERLEAENEGLHAALLALERQMEDKDAELDELEDELQDLDEAREGRSKGERYLAEAAGARSADPGEDKDEDKGGRKVLRNGPEGGAAGDVDAALRVEEMGADNHDHFLTAEGRLELEKELEDRTKELDRERKMRAALEQVNLFADAPKHLACLYSTSALLDDVTGRGQRPPAARTRAAARLPNRSLAHTCSTTCSCTAHCHARRLP
jgi:hypothetical protein